MARHVHALRAVLAVAHLVHVGLPALQEHEREVPLAARLVGGLGLLVGQGAHRAVGIVLEVNHEQIGGHGLVRMAQFSGQVLGDLHGEPREVALAAEVGAQLLREQAVLGELAALAVDVAERPLRVARHVALGVLVGKVELLLGVHVHARHEVEDVQDGVVDLHEGPLATKTVDDQDSESPLASGAKAGKTPNLPRRAQPQPTSGAFRIFP